MKKLWLMMKGYWWILPLAALLGFSIHKIKSYHKLEDKLAATQKTLKSEREAWKRERKDAAQAVKDIDQQYRMNLEKAELRYHSGMKAFGPLVITNEKVVKEYAQTPQGRAVCLDADGVRRLQAARSRLLSEHPASTPTTP